MSAAQVTTHINSLVPAPPVFDSKFVSHPTAEDASAKPLVVWSDVNENGFKVGSLQQGGSATVSVRAELINPSTLERVAVANPSDYHMHMKVFPLNDLANPVFVDLGTPVYLGADLGISWTPPMGLPKPSYGQLILRDTTLSPATGSLLNFSSANVYLF